MVVTVRNRSFLFLLLFGNFLFASVDSEDVPESIRSQLLSVPEKRRIAKIHYDWYGYSLKRLMVQMGKGVLKNLDSVSAKSQELEKIAKCLTYAKMKEMKLKRLGWKRNERKSPFKKKVPKDEFMRRRVKRSYRLKDKQFFIKTQQSYSLKDRPSSPISNFSNLLLTLLKNTTSSETEEKWASTFRRMKRLNKNLERSRSSTYWTIKQRAFDLVLDDENHSDENLEIPVPVSHPLIQDGLKLLNTITGNRKTPISARILSPRIAPLTSSNSHGILSPSIFPFYKDDVEDQLFPIPDLIEKSGFERSEKDKLLAFLMEISRTRPILDEAMKMVKLLNPEKKSFAHEEEHNAVLSATDKMSKDFEGLEKSLTAGQRKELKTGGFSLLEMPQMESLFGKYDAGSLLRHPEMASYSNYTKSERMLSLWKSIENIAFPFSSRRAKRGRTIRVGDVTVYTALNPTVLSPYMFSPVYGLSVLGPVIFSPNIFSPLILNPSVLSPWIFSPAFPLPFILSPYVLSPYIFSPLVMAPFILNPYVLSPNIFNPYVLSPLVLSPLFLCPDVFSPMVLGGVILSPNSFSPAVFSKSYIMATVLSPTVLS